MNQPRLQLTIDEAEDHHEVSTKKVLFNLSPWGGSAFLHVGCLLLLMLWQIPISSRGSLQLTAFTGLADTENDELMLAVEAAIESPAEQSSPAADFTIPEPDHSLPLQSEETPLLELVEPTEDVAIVVAEPAPSVSVTNDIERPTIGSGGSLYGADTIEEAVDRITGGIQGRLEVGDLLVVWLLDSSRSLEADRVRVSKRLGRFLSAIGEGSGPSHRLLNAVVAFGAKVDERVSPTDSTQRILHSIETTPIDTTGKEYVFAAVEKSVAKYRKKWKEQLMLVIWTDESGDDAARLEETIRRCTKADVSVSVIGPSAVLGAIEATDDYRDPKSGKVFALPVSRGPDTAWPERIRLGYWHRVRRSGPAMTDQQGRFPAWYGGQDLAGLLSGFSPYALTRLSLATGGSFTIFDRPDERPPFNLERMQDYLPSYDSAKKYRQSLEAHPLRSSVMEAVKLTYGSSRLEPPPLQFFGRTSPVPPHRFEAFYLTPARFRSQIRATKAGWLRAAEHASTTIELALKQVSQDKHNQRGLDEQYEQEESPRWRAWYDVTRGRLLAHSVRWHEYRLTCEQLSKRDFLSSSTNCIRLLPATNLRTEESTYHDRAEEASALLQRCTREHAETPWALLAERELAQGLGLTVQQLTLQPTGTVEPEKAPKLPKF